MGKIYENATCVLAWLGLLDDTSRIATKYISGFHIPYDGILPHHLIIDNETMEALLLFCTREYWTRLWIIQELVVASHITLHCGRWVCSWADFSWFFEMAGDQAGMQQLTPQMSNTDIDPEFLPVMKSVPMNLMRERRWHGLKAQRPLFELCIVFGSSNCEDRRDKVFGLQAFTLACCREAVEVNYSSSVSEVSRRLLSHHGSSHEKEDDYGSRIIGHAQELHRVLRLTEHDMEGPTWPTILGGPERRMTIEKSPVIISAFLLSRIAYVSGSLTEVGTKKVKLPNLAFPKGLHPYCVEPIHSEAWKGDLESAYELKVVSRLVTGDFQCFTPLKHRLSGNQNTFIVTKLSRVLRREHLGYGSKKYLQHVLEVARDAVLEAGTYNCQLAVDEMGLIFFAPFEAKVGDIVGGFNNSDILLITRAKRNSTLGCHMIGRGVDFFDTLRLREKPNPCTCDKRSYRTNVDIV
jgi:Heterokaryon incompatibility protein (HET)